MECFELIVIGGGPGGYLCAELASAAGLSTALIEKRALGGTCLNEGCVPTKTILNSAKLYRHALDSAPFGVTVEGAKLDHAKVIARKNDVVRTLVSGVAGTLKRNKVTVLTGDAEIQGRDAEGFHVTVNGEAVTGRRLVLATGSETTVPPIPGLHEGLESGFVITNREALANEQLPKTMVVMGGGVLLKYNARQTYTTSGFTGAAFTAICKKAGVPVQVFANRADVPGGSTLGNLLGHQILMPMVDIGLGQLAMHSAMETASCADAEYMAKAVAEYYNTPIFQPKDGEWKLGL